MRRLAATALVAAVAASAALSPAEANPAGASQAVAAVPETVFGFSVGASSQTRSGSTIPVDIHSERVGQTIVTTLAPRD